MGTKGRSSPRIVCCAIPIARAAGKILLVTSRKRPDIWVCKSYAPTPISTGVLTCPLNTELSLTTIVCSFTCLVPKGGWESSDMQLEAAASREALEEGPTRSSLRLLIS